MHPLVRELVALLPGGEAAFPEPARKRWVVAVEAALELLYGEGDDGQPPARPRHRALPATELDLRDPSPADYSADYEVRYSGEYAAEYPTSPADYREPEPGAYSSYTWDTSSNLPRSG